jgi:hypothetical protein
VSTFLFKAELAPGYISLDGFELMFYGAGGVMASVRNVNVSMSIEGGTYLDLDIRIYLAAGESFTTDDIQKIKDLINSALYLSGPPDSVALRTPRLIIPVAPATQIE